MNDDLTPHRNREEREFARALSRAVKPPQEPTPQQLEALFDRLTHALQAEEQRILQERRRSRQRYTYSIGRAAAAIVILACSLTLCFINGSRDSLRSVAQAPTPGIARMLSAPAQAPSAATNTAPAAPVSLMSADSAPAVGSAPQAKAASTGFRAAAPVTAMHHRMANTRATILAEADPQAGGAPANAGLAHRRITTNPAAEKAATLHRMATAKRARATAPTQAAPVAAPMRLNAEAAPDNDDAEGQVEADAAPVIPAPPIRYRVHLPILPPPPVSHPSFPILPTQSP